MLLSGEIGWRELVMRECNAEGCGAVVPEVMYFCTKHWCQVPAALRRTLRERVEGTVAWERAMDAAVEAVALAEGKA